VSCPLQGADLEVDSDQGAVNSFLLRVISAKCSLCTVICSLFLADGAGAEQLTLDGDALFKAQSGESRIESAHVDGSLGDAALG
jgi:hypothetical protein